MSSRATTDAIQKDWNEREMIEVVHLNILKVRLKFDCIDLEHILC